MIGRRGLALALLLAGCGQAPSNDAQPAPAPPANVAGPPPEAPPAPDPEALEGLSPSQRRAYQKGLEDCRAGRYEPDRWPEAYRIGCAAAHDGQAG